LGNETILLSSDWELLVQKGTYPCGAFGRRKNHLKNWKGNEGAIIRTAGGAVGCILKAIAFSYEKGRVRKGNCAIRTKKL